MILFLLTAICKFLGTITVYATLVALLVLFSTSSAVIVVAVFLFAGTDLLVVREMDRHGVGDL